MKARKKELLDRAVAATVAAIEIYNKPDFLYREEAFAVLAINGWELLLKAKWLADHGNKVNSLYVMEPRTKKDGTKSKKLQIKETRSGNPFTHSLDFLAKKLVHSKAFDANAWANIQALLEMRDSSIHFYNRAGAFPVRLQEIGAASLKNFVAATKSWFGRDMSEFNFYLMPLSFISLPQQTEAVILNHEEKKFLAFVESLELFCVGLFPENGCRFFLNDGGRDPIISGPSVVQNRFMLSPTSAWCPVSAVQPSVQAPQPLTPQRPGKNAEHTQGSLPKKWGAENPGQRLQNFSGPIFLPKRWAV